MTKADKELEELAKLVNGILSKTNSYIQVSGRNNYIAIDLIKKIHIPLKGAEPQKDICLKSLFGGNTRQCITFLRGFQSIVSEGRIRVLNKIDR